MREAQIKAEREIKTDKLQKEIDENTIETNFFFLHKEKHIEQISKFSIQVLVFYF